MRKVLDWVLRISASLTALALVPFLLFVGILASDPGTRAAVTAGGSIFLFGIVFAGFVLWASFRHWPSKSPQAGGRRLLSLVVVGIVYPRSLHD